MFLTFEGEGYLVPVTEATLPVILSVINAKFGTEYVDLDEAEDPAENDLVGCWEKEARGAELNDVDIDAPEMGFYIIDCYPDVAIAVLEAIGESPDKWSGQFIVQ